MFRNFTRALALSAAATMVCAATSAAAATTTVTTTTTSSTASAPAPAPKAAHGSLTIFLPDAFAIRGNALTVTGRAVHVSGVVRPYVAGQWVTVRAYMGRSLIKRDRLRIKPSRNHGYGSFTERVVGSSAGIVTVQVTHARTAAQVGFQSVRRFATIVPRAGFGSTGRFVQLIQQRLAALHFWIPQTGVYDNGTGLAIDAYHRLLGWGTSQSLDGRTVSFLLNGWGEFKVRFPRHGRHAEGNLARQLLALIDGSKVDYIFPISSGKPSTPTVLGDFHVYSRVPGYLPDGMYFSSFFIGGYAIHGYDPAPDYPASHGCMRLPIPDAIPAYHWLTMGDWVDVYY
jgi:hypothetical protein